MDIIRIVDTVRTKISKIKEINNQNYMSSSTIEIEELRSIEKDLEFILPNNLRKFYLEQDGNLKYSWEITQDSMSLELNNGWLNILSPNEILEFYNDMKEIIEETEENIEDLALNEGAIALVEDWRFWIPIITFSNGDAFCIDKRSKTKEIVFLEHDVIDGGPNLHGLKIANNFEELINKWSKVAFVDVYDWTKGVNDEGIDLTKEIYKSLLELIDNKR